MYMNKRITIAVLVMLVLAVATAYANGQADTVLEKKESVTLTGKVTVSNRMMPELAANGKTYLLLVPRFLPIELNVKDGDEVTVTGSVVSVKDSAALPSYCRIATADNLVSVDKATINGKEYDLGDFQGKFQRGMNRGMGRGMMRGYGFGDSSK